jgi:hypothetical protein
MTDTRVLATALASPINFSIGEVRHDLTVAPATVTPAPLGPLAAFTGNWIGSGFNTIFRPNNRKSDNTGSFPVPPEGGDESVLELNLTSEILSFAPNLVSIPNRGFGAQEDIFHNGVPYLQSINDVTTLPAQGIHLEPGIWLHVPATTTPDECVTLARMACIPHGTTINAQGTFKRTAGRPVIPCVHITPRNARTGEPAPDGTFPSLTACNQNTFRIPQDLTDFIAAGTITQKMLEDPNTVLGKQIAHQNIRETVTIDISTVPALPLFGDGGLANIAFLLGVNPPPPDGMGPNAQAVRMNATFWIETVIYQVSVPPMSAGDAPLVLPPVQTDPPVPLVPRFLVSIPFGERKKFAGGTITMSTTQIQYSQEVILRFAELSWPHVSVASLVPADPIPVPASLLPLT